MLTICVTLVKPNGAEYPLNVRCESYTYDEQWLTLRECTSIHDRDLPNGKNTYMFPLSSIFMMFINWKDETRTTN